MNNYMFVHIPKTGGISLINKLKGQSKVLGHNARSSSYKYLKDFDEKDRDNNVIFTIVRNPYDRLVSAFFYLNKGGINKFDEMDRQKYIAKYKGNFKKFVMNSFKDKNIINQIHFKPQYKWVCDDNNKSLVDYILKFEDLQNDIYSLENNTQLKIGKLQHLNKTNHKHSLEYYDKEIKDVIYKFYKKDFKIFKYKRN